MIGMHTDLLAERSKLTNHPLHPQTADAHAGPGLNDGPEPTGAGLASMLAENRELRAQVEQLRSERNRLAEQQTRIQELLKAASPDKLLHDLRNLLNERDLLKALVDEL